jgi:hypothetical protein
MALLTGENMHDFLLTINWVLHLPFHGIRAEYQNEEG